jgi:copper chaperone CopZ
MKKTIILTVAALMTLSTAVSYASTVVTAETAVLTDKKPAKKKGEIKEVTFNVHLHCANCVKKVQENISFEKGVKDLHVCLDDQTVSIKYDAAKTNEATLKAAIEKLGYPVSGKREGGHAHGHSHGHNN